MEVGEGKREMKERVWGPGRENGLKCPHYPIDYEGGGGGGVEDEFGVL